MGPVDVVVGAYEEAERMLLMLNKNPGALSLHGCRNGGAVRAKSCIGHN